MLSMNYFHFSRLAFHFYDFRSTKYFKQPTQHHPLQKQEREKAGKEANKPDLAAKTLWSLVFLLRAVTRTLSNSISIFEMGTMI